MSSPHEQPPFNQASELTPFLMPRGTNKGVISFTKYCVSHGDLNPSTALSALADSFPQEIPADQDERSQIVNAWVVKSAADLAETDERRTAPESDWINRGQQEAETHTHAEETLQRLADLGVMGDPAKLRDFSERIASYLRYRRRHGEQRMTRNERHYLLGPEQNLFVHLGRRALDI